MFGCLPGNLARVFCMLGKQFQPLARRIRRDCAVGLRQVVVNRQRPLATGLVLDRGNKIAIGIEQIDRRGV